MINILNKGMSEDEKDLFNELIFQYDELMYYVLRNKCEINMQTVISIANNIKSIEKDIELERKYAT